MLRLALRLRDATQWSNAIQAADFSRIYSKVYPDTGEFDGDIRYYGYYYELVTTLNCLNLFGGRDNFPN